MPLSNGRPTPDPLPRTEEASEDGSAKRGVLLKGSTKGKSQPCSIFSLCQPSFLAVLKTAPVCFKWHALEPTTCCPAARLMASSSWAYSRCQEAKVAVNAEAEKQQHSVFL